MKDIVGEVAGLAHSWCFSGLRRCGALCALLAFHWIRKRFQTAALSEFGIKQKEVSMNSSQIIAALKSLLPAVEPLVAQEIDALLVKAEAAIDAKIGSPDIKLGADLIMQATQKFVDFEMAKFAPGAVQA